MITIEPTIKIYDDEGNLSRAYDKAVDKMIDKTYDIDLEQFDFDEVARDIMKEINNLCFRDLTKYLNELKDEEDD